MDYMKSSTKWSSALQNFPNAIKTEISENQRLVSCHKLVFHWIAHICAIFMLLWGLSVSRMTMDNMLQCSDWMALDELLHGVNAW